MIAIPSHLCHRRRIGRASGESVWVSVSHTYFLSPILPPSLLLILIAHLAALSPPNSHRPSCRPSLHPSAQSSRLPSPSLLVGLVTGKADMDSSKKRNRSSKDASKKKDTPETRNRSNKATMEVSKSPSKAPSPAINKSGIQLSNKVTPTLKMATHRKNIQRSTDASNWSSALTDYLKVRVRRVPSQSNLIVTEKGRVVTTATEEVELDKKYPSLLKLVSSCQDETALKRTDPDLACGVNVHNIFVEKPDRAGVYMLFLFQYLMSKLGIRERKYVFVYPITPLYLANKSKGQSSSFMMTSKNRLGKLEC